MANRRITETLLAATPANALTVTGGQVARDVHLHFVNNHASESRSITVWFVPSGATRGNEHRVIHLAGDSLLPAGKLLGVVLQAHLQAGDIITWASDASNDVSAHGWVREVVPNGHINIPAQYLTTSLTTLNTGGVTSGYASTVVSLILCNHAVTEQGVEVQVIPSGDSAANKHRIHTLADKLRPGAFRVLRMPTMFEAAGTTIQAKAESTTSVVVAGAVFEEAI